ncbi:Protein EMBRYONIC FLOWER [Arachis hypogaea]|nr:Protein EMBRYONIC FLOWER [Arachis hypogaea]
MTSFARERDRVPLPSGEFACAILRRGSITPFLIASFSVALLSPNVPNSLVVWGQFSFLLALWRVFGVIFLNHFPNKLVMVVNLAMVELLVKTLVCLREWLVVGAHFKVYPSSIAVIELMMGSFVQVNSISIDLADAIGDKASAGKCQHFSIRGYVSEIRKKDWKKCWPFPVNESEENPSLPPLDVPTYRCFGCESCHQESVTKDMDKDGQTDFNCCSSGCKSDTNCGKAAVKSLISSCQIYIILKGKIVKSMLLEGLAFLLNTQILSLQEKELILKKSQVQESKRNLLKV